MRKCDAPVFFGPATRVRIDLNADVGEAEDEAGIAREAALVRCCSSVNVACGAHAGSDERMRQTVRLAQAASCAIGAHPGYADRAHFGRRTLAISTSDVETLMTDQLRRLDGHVRAAGARLSHVKPHGALYNSAAVDRSLAEAIARAVLAFDPSLVLVGPPGSAMADEARRAGLDVVAEGFADRAYRPDGTLVPRSEPGAVLDEVDAVLRQALDLVLDGRVRAVDGSWVSMPIDTICLHGDTPAAVEMARRLRASLQTAGITVAARPRSSGSGTA